MLWNLKKKFSFQKMIMGLNFLQKTDASLHPNQPSGLMNAFTPPVPAIPAELKSSVSTLRTDFATSDGHRAVDPRKPLPPIFQSPSIMRESDDLDEKSIVFVDKAMPPLPPATPIRNTTNNASTITNKRRSMSVSDVDPIFPSTPIVVTPPTLKIANSRRSDGGPSQAPDGHIPGLLDLFKGDLSAFEPFSGPPLDLRDLSTPVRPIISRSPKADAPIWSSHETSNKTEKSEAKAAISDPFGGILSAADGGGSSSATTLFPPRTSSLKLSARHSQQLTTMRHPPPARSRTAPNTSTQTLAPRPAGMRHYSNASISEPSLVPSGDGQLREYLCSCI